MLYGAGLTSGVLRRVPQAASGGDGAKSEVGAETEASRKRKRKEEKAAAKSNKKAREKFNF